MPKQSRTCDQKDRLVAIIWRCETSMKFIDSYPEGYFVQELCRNGLEDTYWIVSHSDDGIAVCQCPCNYFKTNNSIVKPEHQHKTKQEAERCMMELSKNKPKTLFGGSQ